MSPQLSGHRAPRITPLVVARAVLDSGGSLAPDRSAWFTLVESGYWRPDFRPAVLAVAKVLALNADPTMLAAPGIENLERVGGLGRRRVYRVLKRLRDEGLLGWVTTGTTSLRSGNWRATYVLTIPPGIELPPDDEKVSPRRESSRKEDPCARDEHWSDSPAIGWVRRRYAAGWTDRQFWTALTYPTDTTKPLGPPIGRSLWRVLLWRVLQRRGPLGEFTGPEALGVVPGSWVPNQIDRTAEREEWLLEMAQPGARKAVERARAECLRIAHEATRARTPQFGTPAR